MTRPNRHPEPAPIAAEAPLPLAGLGWIARCSGALWAPRPRLLAVADLHLGKAARAARIGGPMLPPYETEETLARLAAEIDAVRPAHVVCLGDSFDDRHAAGALSTEDRERLLRLQAGRRWTWIAGNHDPAAPELGGEARSALDVDGVRLQHIADPTARLGEGPGGSIAEVSGHYHPKAILQIRGRKMRRRAFLCDRRRAILPAFGAYAGGLDLHNPVFDRLLGPDAVALLCSPGAVHALPKNAL